MKNIRFRRWIIVIVIMVIVTYLYRNTLGNILYEIKNLPAAMTMISLLFMVISYLIEGKLIQFVASRHVVGFSWEQGTAVAYISSFYRFLTMGAAAGPAEVFYLNQKDIPLSRATGMCLVKYIIHRITIVSYGLTSYLLLTQGMKRILKPYRTFIIIGILVTFISAATLIAICTSRHFSGWVILMLNKIPLKKQKLLKKRKELIDSINTLQEESTVLIQNKKNVLWMFLLNLGKQTCYYLIPAIFLYHRSDISVANVIALMAICNMLAGVLPAPSGIGSLELVFLQLFQTLTMAEIAASVILLYRFATWMMPFAIGGVFVALEKKHNKKTANIEEPPHKHMRRLSKLK